MLEFLDYLEQKQGGQGNGFLFVKNGRIDYADKAVKLSNETIVSELYNNIPDWFMYHTRIASKGSVIDKNCHPYTNETGSFSLMMNGTDSSFGALGKEEDITDTEVIFNLFNNTDTPLKALTRLTPRFMGFKDSKVFVTNPDGYGGLEYISEGDHTIIASCFPNEYDSKMLKKETLWFEGEELIEEPKIVNKRISYSEGTIFDYDSGYNYDNSWVWKGLKKEAKLVEPKCEYGYVSDYTGQWVSITYLEKVTKANITDLVVELKQALNKGESITELLEDIYGEAINYNGECVVFDFNQDTLYLSNPETLEARYEFDLNEL